MSIQPLILKTNSQFKNVKFGVVEHGVFDKASKGWGEPTRHDVRTTCRTKGHYIVDVRVDGKFAQVGTVVQQAVGIYTLNFLHGSSYSDRLTLAQAVETVVHAYLNDAESKAYQATPEGQAEKAAQDARIAEADAARKTREARMTEILGRPWKSGSPVSPSDLDTLLALIPATVKA